MQMYSLYIIKYSKIEVNTRTIVQGYENWTIIQNKKASKDFSLPAFIKYLIVYIILPHPTGFRIPFRLEQRRIHLPVRMVPYRLRLTL